MKLFAFLAFLLWLAVLFTGNILQNNGAVPHIARVAPERIKAAVWKIGPKYDTEIMPDGRLYVWIDGKRLRMGY